MLTIKFVKRRKRTEKKTIKFVKILPNFVKTISVIITNDMFDKLLLLLRIYSIVWYNYYAVDCFDSCAARHSWQGLIENVSCDHFRNSFPPAWTPKRIISSLHQIVSNGVSRECSHIGCRRTMLFGLCSLWGSRGSWSSHVRDFHRRNAGRSASTCFAFFSCLSDSFSLKRAAIHCLTRTNIETKLS